jgi:hypothetical protein
MAWDVFVRILGPRRKLGNRQVGDLIVDPAC